MPDIRLGVATAEGKTWLARITGTDSKYGFQREFVVASESNLSRSGMTGYKVYSVTDGVYESNEGRRRYGRRFWRVTGDEVTEISRADVTEAE